MLSLDYRSQESHVRYWSGQCLDFAYLVQDPSLKGAMEKLQDALEQLKHDRRMLFIGAKASGKSTLLAGLAQTPFMATHVLQDRCVRWRYSCRDGDVSYSRFIDDRELVGLELVDTAPLEDEGQLDFVSSMVGRSDVLVCVLNALDTPSHARMWEFIEALPTDWTGHCVVAVTHTDLLAAQASLDLKAALRERCHQFNQHAVALYFVPAIIGSRTMEVFTARMEETLNSPQCHRAAIRHLAQLCDDLLHRQRSVLSAREVMQRSDYGFVDSIDKEIDDFQQSQLLGCHDAVEYYLNMATDTMPHFFRVLLRAIRSCSTPSGLMQMEYLPESTELYFYRSFCAQMLSRQTDADQQLLITCEAHWRDVRPRMQKTLGCDIDEFNKSKLNHDLSLLRERFARRIYDVFMGQRLRCQFSQILLSRLAWLRWCFLLLCIILVIAGILGTLEFNVYAFAMIGLACIFWCMSLVSLYRVSQQIRQGMQAAIEQVIDRLREVLEEPMKIFIIQRVEAYRRMYALPRKTLAQQAASLEPMIKRHSELQRHLRALEPYL